MTTSCNTPKVSVILPVYKVEAYIGKCLHALQTQTLKEMEFIFVDDCGGDGSMDIVRRHAELDPRIVVLDGTVNQGSGPSRNRGIEAARGEYIGFVDPDDWVSADFFELLYEKAVAEQADIAKGEVCYVLDNTYQKTLKMNNAIRRYMSEGRWPGIAFRTDFWTAIYRTELLRSKNICFPALRQAQDVVFVLSAVAQTNKIALEDRATYFYLQERPGAATKKCSPAYFATARESVEMRGRILESANISKQDLLESWHILLGSMLYYQIRRAVEPTKEFYINFFTSVKEVFLNSGHANELCAARPSPIYLDLLTKTPQEIVESRLETLPVIDAPLPAKKQEAHPQPALQPSGVAICAWRYPIYRRRYKYYRLMSCLSFGKRKRHYKEKKQLYGQLLRDIRSACQDITGSRGLKW